MKQQSPGKTAAALLAGNVLQLTGLGCLVWAAALRRFCKYLETFTFKKYTFAKYFGIAADLRNGLSTADAVLWIGVLLLVLGTALLILGLVLALSRPKEGLADTQRAASVSSAAIYSAGRPAELYTAPQEPKPVYYPRTFPEPVRSASYQGALRCLSGAYQGYTFPVDDQEEIAIGSSRQFCSIILGNDGNISRYHCSVKFDGFKNSYLVTDFSARGTFLSDGRRLPSGVPVRLFKGEIIYLSDGENSFRLE